MTYTIHNTYNYNNNITKPTKHKHIKDHKIKIVISSEEKARQDRCNTNPYVVQFGPSSFVHTIFTVVNYGTHAPLIHHVSIYIPYM